jgi:hypothetical protein
LRKSRRDVAMDSSAAVFMWDSPFLAQRCHDEGQRSG